jgi:hypothetical protein
MFLGSVGAPFLRPGLHCHRAPRAAAVKGSAQPPLRGEHGEHGEHWTLMAVARGATLDQAEGVRTSASHNPYSAREAEPGSPSKNVTATASISVILLMSKKGI